MLARHYHVGAFMVLAALRVSARSRPAMMLAFFFLALAASQSSHAQSVDSLVPAVIGSTTPLEKSNDLRAQPLALLAKFPEAGAAMARYVPNLITSDPPVVDSILSIINVTSPEQASAIGAGLVRGVRAMDAKRPGSAQAISAKVMRSDNTWLKTTFGAIGLYSARNTEAILADLITPNEIRNAEVGESLPNDSGRVGPSKKWVSFAEPYHRKRKNPSKSNGFELSSTDGMIVAIIASDASSNGAVSTSPSL